MVSQVYINLPVADVEKATAFYQAIGFQKNEDYSDATASGMSLDGSVFVMLLEHAKFREFSPLPICNTQESIEVLNALQCDDPAEVDTLVSKALAAGGNTYKDVQDMGFMYGHGFQDIDGHVWEVFAMAPEND